MRWKLAAVLGAATAGLVVAAPFAVADDVEGGHCEYGDFSVNVEPSCDTSESDGPDSMRIRPVLDELEPTLGNPRGGDDESTD